MCYNDNGDSMERIIFHIDVNNAFLSWSALDLLKRGSKIDIRNIDAVIGGDVTTRRGIVLAKSISAKKSGVITGERLCDALKKCPDLKTYPPTFDIYTTMSNAMFELLYKYSPDIEIFSIDECSLDYGKVKKMYGDELLFAVKISKEIKETLGFTVNIGIGNNKLCAKMASDFSKPDKIHTLYDDEIKEKLWPLPVDELLWIGKKSSIKLHSLNINTIGDLANADSNVLYKYFKNQALKMIESAKGIDDTPVISTASDPKGISNSTTIERDLDNKRDIYKVIDVLCDNVSVSLRKQNKYATVICVTLKDQYFHSYSHQKRLVNATNLTAEITSAAKHLFDEMWNEEPIRLVGVSLTNLVATVNHQVSLFESLENREKSNILESTVDKLKDKYGAKVIKNASLVDTKIKKKP